MANDVIQVFTFKRGLLSPIAHDLRLGCERFELSVQQGQLIARFDARSLRVDGVMRRGQLEPHGLSEDQKREIVDTVQRVILDTARHPEIVYCGPLDEQAGRYVVEGRLTLRGVEQPLTAVGTRSAQRVRGELELVPSRFGIQPYTALLGAIRLEDRVLVRFDLNDRNA